MIQKSCKCKVATPGTMNQQIEQPSSRIYSFSICSAFVFITTSSAGDLYVRETGLLALSESTEATILDRKGGEALVEREDGSNHQAWCEGLGTDKPSGLQRPRRVCGHFKRQFDDPETDWSSDGRSQLPEALAILCKFLCLFSEKVPVSRVLNWYEGRDLREIRNHQTFRSRMEAESASLNGKPPSRRGIFLLQEIEVGIASLQKSQFVASYKAIPVRMNGQFELFVHPKREVYQLTVQFLCKFPQEPMVRTDALCRL